MTKEPTIVANSKVLAERWYNEATEFHRRGRLNEAEKLYRLVLDREPEHFGSLHLLGVVHAQRGAHEAALRYLDAALAINGNHPDALNNRGIALKELKRVPEALAAYERAIALDPDNVNALVNLGNVLVELKRPEEALQFFNRAVALAPEHAHAFHNRGHALVDLERLEEALACYNRAIQLNPNVAEYFNSRGTTVKDLGSLHDALVNYDRCLALDPQHGDALNNRGVVLMELGRLDDALASYDRAIALNPQYDEPYNNRGMAKLLLGRFAESWADYEHRWKSKTFLGALERPNVGARWWSGEDLDGRRILVFAEQGLGDIIQFARYLPLLAERGAKVTFLVRPTMFRVLDALRSSGELVSHIEPGTSFDFQCALMSLPGGFSTCAETIPCHVPYLQPEPELVERWKHQIGASGFRIGIAWHAKSGTIPAVRQHGLKRSFPLAELAPLARIPGVRLISLQKQDGVDELFTLPADMRVETLGDGFDNAGDAFIDTAAVMQNLDLIVTADTSIAHLAGALGRPAWVLLKYVPDWRWLLDRDDSPWYPTLRLFRQDADGDWASAIAKAVDVLRGVM